MPKSLSYIFCNVDVYDHYMIVVMKPGVHLTPNHNKILEEIVNTHYYDRPFVYLTHRIHSYSVDPAIYFETAKIENLAGFGVIAEVPVSGGNAEIEKLFMNKPFEIFSDLEIAITWAKHLIANEHKGT